MSHVEILELNDSHGRSKICFYPQPKYIDPNLEPITHVPEDIYKTSGEGLQRQFFLTATNLLLWLAIFVSNRYIYLQLQLP